MDDTTVSEIARTQRLRTLLEGKACCRCGETGLEMIRPYSCIDLHHLVGRANDPDLVVYLCSRCHDWAHARLKELGIVDLSPKPQRNLLEVIAIILKVVGHTLKDWGDHFGEYAERLAALIEELDAQDPSWRGLPEAQL